MITVVVKCKNEEYNIPKMLDSVKSFADSASAIRDYDAEQPHVGALVQ